MNLQWYSKTLLNEPKFQLLEVKAYVSNINGHIQDRISFIDKRFKTSRTITVDSYDNLMPYDYGISLLKLLYIDYIGVITEHSDVSVTFAIPTVDKRYTTLLENFKNVKYKLCENVIDTEI